MKKSIVLLISLFFIIAISALILKNLDDTDNYISLQNSKFNKIQLIVTVKNLQKEVSSIFSQNQDKIDYVIEKNLMEYFPIRVNDLDVKFKILPYERLDINQLSSTDELKRAEAITFLNSHDVYNTDNLRYLLKDNKIKTNKQLDDIINIFIKETYDDKILKVRDLIGLKDGINDKFYELFIRVDYLKEILKAYYILNKDGGVEYFELSFN